VKLDVSDLDGLRPVIRAAVVAVLEELRADEAHLGDRLGYPEAEAAALLGVERHTLRDCRLRGEITGRLIGKRIVYGRAELVRFLDGAATRGRAK
jgi:hypothetical protein